MQNDNLKLKINLLIQIWKEGKMFVAYAPQFEVSSCGKTLEEAKKNLKEAVSLWCEEIRLPLKLEKGDDGFYTAECRNFSGCYSQGKTLKKALINIKEVVKICLTEKI